MRLTFLIFLFLLTSLNCPYISCINHDNNSWDRLEQRTRIANKKFFDELESPDSSIRLDALKTLNDNLNHYIIDADFTFLLWMSIPNILKGLCDDSDQIKVYSNKIIDYCSENVTLLFSEMLSYYPDACEDARSIIITILVKTCDSSVSNIDHYPFIIGYIADEPSLAVRLAGIKALGIYRIRPNSTLQYLVRLYHDNTIEEEERIAIIEAIGDYGFPSHLSSMRLLNDIIENGTDREREAAKRALNRLT